MAKIIEKNESLSVDKLEEFEKRHNISFSKEYKKFLLDFNGGNTDKSIFKIQGNEGEYESIVNVFYGIGEMYDNLEKKFEFFDELLDVGFAPIADDPGGNQICIGLNQSHYGKIYFWEHELVNEDEMDNLFFVANSFNEFFDSLYDN